MADNSQPAPAGTPARLLTLAGNVAERLMMPLCLDSLPHVAIFHGVVYQIENTVRRDGVLWAVYRETSSLDVTLCPPIAADGWGHEARL